jgi:tRNA-2-methylthio-N6-dimethylallyladenosine synthase
MIVGFPGETEADFEETISLLDVVRFDAIFGFKYSARPNTPALVLEDAIPEEEKVRRLGVLLDRQRQIQRESYQRHLGDTVEVMVESRNEARGQWMGRTTQNKTLNFTAPDGAALETGRYVPVKVITCFPNSLLGELAV